MIELILSETEEKDLSTEEKEIAKVRKLEIMSLPYLKRNVKFFYSGANIPQKEKAYKEKINLADLEKTLKEKKYSIPTVCKPLCELVAEILNENGINAETVSCDTDIFKHTDVLVTTSSGKKYIVNFLEDMERVQTGMYTPDFASEKYYIRRYKKFEGKTTTDGKDISNIGFVTKEQLDKIDTNLGYKKCKLYMDDVIEQIREEFENLSKYGEQIDVFENISNMSEDEILDRKIEFLLKYFNDRMSITGHADFVMYYSQLLLKNVFSEDEYRKLVRYDCFAKKNQIPRDSKINQIIDDNNLESNPKNRFCLLDSGKRIYAFSTKPNAYAILEKEEFEELKNYAKVLKSEKPSDVVIALCDKGNGLPLIFHPLGSKLLNERVKLINDDLLEEEKQREFEKLIDSIKATDGELTSLTIPYPDGTEKFIYLNEDKEFIMREGKKATIYHFNEEDETFNLEDIYGDGER